MIKIRLEAVFWLLYLAAIFACMGYLQANDCAPEDRPVVRDAGYELYCSGAGTFLASLVWPGTLVARFSYDFFTQD